MSLKCKDHGSVKVLGVVWPGKTKVIPKIVIDKIYPRLLHTNDCKAVIRVCRIAGILESIYLTSGINSEIMAKCSIHAAHSHNIFDPTLQCELDVHVPAEGIRWTLWK